MQKRVIYIHGYGSSGNTDTAKGLRATLGPDCELISPSYDWSQPAFAAECLRMAYHEHLPQKPLIVGTSLGGFFANYLARLLNTPAILVNPSLYPSKSLSKYGESQATLREYAELEQTEAGLKTRPERVLVLGMNDDVLDHRENGLKLKDSARTVLLNMGHRIQPEYYETIARLIEGILQPNQPAIA